MPMHVFFSAVHSQSNFHVVSFLSFTVSICMTLKLSNNDFNKYLQYLTQPTKKKKAQNLNNVNCSSTFGTDWHLYTAHFWAPPQSQSSELHTVPSNSEELSLI